LTKIIISFKYMHLFWCLDCKRMGWTIRKKRHLKCYFSWMSSLLIHSSWGCIKISKQLLSKKGFCFILGNLMASFLMFLIVIHFSSLLFVIPTTILLKYVRLIIELQFSPSSSWLKASMVWHSYHYFRYFSIAFFPLMYS